MKFHTRYKIIGIILFSTAIALFFYFAPKGHGDLTFKVKMDKNQAVASAKSIAEKYGLETKTSEQIANFSIDEESQTYYELEVGDYKSLNELIEKEEGFIPAIWTVSILPGNSKDRLDVYFTPSGKPYGFYYKIPESSPGAALSYEEAKLIAESQTVKDWGLDLSDYSTVDESLKKQQNGRIDYNFYYERKTKLGEAKDKIALQVTGDKLTKFRHYLEVPEAFSRSYSEKRSANDNIAMIAMVFFYILIFIVGLFCFFYLSKKKLITWKKPLVISAVIAILLFLGSLTTAKSELISIDTSVLTPKIFYIITILGLLLVAVLTALFTFLSIFIGEGLTRKAFPRHLNFWRMLSVRNLGSWQFLNSVILGYIFVAVMLVYETVFYDAVNRLPGWWQPASMITDPNIQTNWFAWLTGFAQALNAGIFEEFGFRAIPISLGLLIGNKYNKRKLGIVLAFIFQILMFSAGHANYPGFPAYARLVELLVVALGFGLMYYFFGIIPGIIAHFTYDFILMSMSVMTTSGTPLVYSKILVVAITLFPLLLATYGRLRNKTWVDVGEDICNESSMPELPAGTSENRGTEIEFEPLDEALEEMVKAVPVNKYRKTKSTAISVLTAFLAVITVASLLTFRSAFPPLKTEKKAAEALALEELNKRGVNLSEEWKTISTVTTIDEEDISSISTLFPTNDVIKLEGREKYKSLISTYIPSSRWNIRFIKTSGDVNERAEEYLVTLTDKEHKINVQHVIPENRKGENLTKEKAQTLLYNAIKAEYGLDKSDLKEISAKDKKLDSRTDWIFTLEDTTISLKEYKPQITATVSGNEVLELNRGLQLSEDRRNSILQGYIKLALKALVILLPFFAALIVTTIRSIIAWTKNQISKPVFYPLFIILLVLNLAALYADTPSAMMNFQTDKPFSSQLIMSYITGVLGRIIISFLAASIAGYSKSFYRKASKNDYFRILSAVSAGVFVFALGIIVISKPLLTVDDSIYNSMGSYSKVLSQISHMCISYINNLTLVLAAIAFISHIKNRVIHFMFTIVLFFILGALPIANFSSYYGMVATGVGGVTYILLYRYLFKQNIALAAIVVGVLNLLKGLRGLVLNQFPPLLISVTVSLAVLLLLIIYTCRLFSGGCGKKSTV